MTGELIHNLENPFSRYLVTGENLFGGKLHLMDFGEFIREFAKAEALQVEIYCDDPYASSTIVDSFAFPKNWQNAIFFTDCPPRFYLACSEKYITATFPSASYFAAIERGKTNVVIGTPFSTTELKSFLNRQKVRLPDSWHINSFLDRYRAQHLRTLHGAL